jgi:hypothetical protein
MVCWALLYRASSECCPWVQPVTSLRGFHVTPSHLADVPVVVPSMGDSISEGSVASLEKKPGIML